VTPDDFNFITKLIKDRSGLVLPTEKLYLLESRLNPLARRHGLVGMEDLVKEIRTHGEPGLIAEVVEAMTTNESLFFRDRAPFHVFEDSILPNLLKMRAAERKLRIWSAACSTGQEPYTLSMILERNEAKLAGWEVEILATDLSSQALERAKAGLYSQFEVQRGLPIELLVQNFTKSGSRWRIKPDFGRRITFRKFNLLDDFGALGRFDVVFCRNVLIYFDETRKTDVLQRMSKAVTKDGLLFLGGSETVFGISDAFTPIKGLRGAYRNATSSGALPEETAL